MIIFLTLVSAQRVYRGVGEAALTKGTTPGRTHLGGGYLWPVQTWP